jgi:hypothetical protein
MLDQTDQATMLDLKEGRLESYLQGRRRKVLVRSIYALAEARLRASDPNARHPQGSIASAGKVEKRRREQAAVETTAGQSGG